MGETVAGDGEDWGKMRRGGEGYGEEDRVVEGRQWEGREIGKGEREWGRTGGQTEEGRWGRGD